MPLFDYKCGKCSVVSELLVKRPDASPPCPLCGSETVKQVSAPYGKVEGSAMVRAWERKHGL